ncbi:MAG: hypothetical protein RQ853_05380 [Acidianus sp.]|nr:hypothetical protein [Acidianus sp.]
MSDRRNTEVYVKAMAELAGLFDKLLVDDFWANWCVDDVEGVEEGDLLLDEAARLRHAAYSSELLYRASEEVVRAARDVNPRVRALLERRDEGRVELVIPLGRVALRSCFNFHVGL